MQQYVRKRIFWSVFFFLTDSSEIHLELRWHTSHNADHFTFSMSPGYHTTCKHINGILLFSDSPHHITCKHINGILLLSDSSQAVLKYWWLHTGTPLDKFFSCRARYKQPLPKTDFAGQLPPRKISKKKIFKPEEKQHNSMNAFTTKTGWLNQLVAQLVYGKVTTGVPDTVLHTHAMHPHWPQHMVCNWWGKELMQQWDPTQGWEHYLFVVCGDAIKYRSHQLIWVLIKQKHWTPEARRKNKKHRWKDVFRISLKNMFIIILCTFKTWEIVCSPFSNQQ